VAWGSVFGLVIGYALLRVRHANSQQICCSLNILPGDSFDGRQEGSFPNDVTMATDRTEVEIGWPRSGWNCLTVVAGWPSAIKSLGRRAVHFPSPVDLRLWRSASRKFSKRNSLGCFGHQYQSLAAYHRSAQRTLQGC
jgi:hypothetical protein